MHIALLPSACLTSTLYFASAPYTTPPVSMLGVHKKLRGNTSGTADAN